MWFNNALIYQYTLKQEIDLASALIQDILKPCPPHARFTYGWLPAFSDEILQNVTGSSLICLGKEERILPKPVIKRFLAERIRALEIQENRTIKRAERTQLAEDLEFELLPKSFCIQKRLPALLDSKSHRLIINTSSKQSASQLISLLRKSVPSIQIEPLNSAHNLAIRFAQWIKNPSLLPASFELASDCLLISLENEKKKINCKGYELPAEEILTLLDQGLAAAEISLIWNERIQFTLTHELTFKRLKCLNYLMSEFEEIRHLDEEYQQQDAELTLLGGELRQLINELVLNVQESEPLKINSSSLTA